MQMRVGGSEAKIMESIATNIQDRIMLRKEIQSVFAEMDVVIRIMDIAPLIGLFIMCAILPEFTRMYFESTQGFLLLAGIIAFSFVGSIIIHRQTAKAKRGDFDVGYHFCNCSGGFNDCARRLRVPVPKETCKNALNAGYEDGSEGLFSGWDASLYTLFCKGDPECAVRKLGVDVERMKKLRHCRAAIPAGMPDFKTGRRRAAAGCRRSIGVFCALGNRRSGRFGVFPRILYPV